MKKITVYSFLLLFLLTGFNTVLYSQQGKVTVENINFESPNSMTFDVMVENTGASEWIYSNGTFVLNLNPAFLNGGSASFSLIPGYSNFPSGAFPPSALISNSYTLRTSANLPGSNGNILPGQKLRLYKFRLQTSASSFASEYFDASWQTSGSPDTKIYTWDNISGTPSEIENPEFSILQLLLEENYDFTGLLTDNGWTAHSGATVNPLTTTTGLTYTDYPGSGVGNAVQIGNAGGEDDNRDFTEQSTDGSSVYYSFLINVNEAASSKSGDYFMLIGNRSSPTSFSSFAARVFVKITSDVVNFGISNSSTPTYGTTPFAKNTTYLMIVKYIINASGNDEVDLWVIDSGIPLTEGDAGTPEVANTTTAGQDIINAVALRQGSASNSSEVILDGIRIGTDWTDSVSFSKHTYNQRFTNIIIRLFLYSWKRTICFTEL